MADGRPTEPTGAGPPPLVFRPHRPQIRRFLWMLVVASLAVLPSYIFLVLGDDEGWDLAFRALFIGYWAILSAYIAFTWGRLLGADALMEVHPAGIRVNDVGRGWVWLPWDAVRSVRKDAWGRIVVKPADGVGPATPGTDWPPDKATARRARRWGFKLPTRVAYPDRGEVLAAVHHFSGGRL